MEIPLAAMSVMFSLQSKIQYEKEEAAVGTNGNGKNGYFVKGLIFGCVGGALAGLLFAPKSGKKLRADIKEKGSDALKDTKEFYFDAQKKAKSVFDDTVDLLSDACVKTKGVFFRS
jgi:hypothetical protein